MNQKLRTAHRSNALLLSAFLAAHVINHGIGAFGIDWHLSTQTALRLIYRQEIVEIALLLAIATQVLFGIALLIGRGKPKNGWAWAQTISGGYLAFFLLQHVTAVLMARFGPLLLDTNSYFAAAVVSRAPFSFYFVPYYVLSITALFTHVSCALRFRHWQTRATKFERMLPVLGFVLGSFAVLGLTGTISQIVLPDAYEAYLSQFSGNE